MSGSSLSPVEQVYLRTLAHCLCHRRGLAMAFSRTPAGSLRVEACGFYGPWAWATIDVESENVARSEYRAPVTPYDVADGLTKRLRALR